MSCGNFLHDIKNYIIIWFDFIERKIIGKIKNDDLVI